MKTLSLFIFAAKAISSFAQTQLPSPTLAGIINVDGIKMAILAEPSPSSRPAREIIIQEGQSEERTTLIEIRPENRTAKINVAGENGPRWVALTNQNPSADSPIGLALENVGLETVLTVYAELSQRTVLRPTVFPNFRISINTSRTNRIEAIQEIKSALTKQQVTIVPDGEKFVLVAPDSMASKLNPQSSKISVPLTNGSTARNYPKNSINWHAAPLFPVLQIYAEFSGKKLDQSEQPIRMPRVEIVLRNETDLSKEEILYAIETVVGWSGVKLVPTSEGFVKAVPVQTETSTRPTK